MHNLSHCIIYHVLCMSIITVFILITLLIRHAINAVIHRPQIPPPTHPMWFGARVPGPALGRGGGAHGVGGGGIWGLWITALIACRINNVIYNGLHCNRLILQYIILQTIIAVLYQNKIAEYEGFWCTELAEKQSGKFEPGTGWSKRARVSPSRMMDDSPRRIHFHVWVAVSRMWVPVIH